MMLSQRGNYMQILICDDEPVLADRVEHWLEEFPERTTAMYIQKHYTGQTVMASNMKYDIAFLDIELGSTTGLEVAQWLQQQNPEVLLIFISSHIEYVPETFKVAAFQFLIKPIQKEELHQEFKRALTKYRQYHDIFTVEGRKGMEDILIGDILFIEVQMKKLYINTAQTTYSFRGSLEDMEARLGNYLFVRCHHSYLVNLRYIQKMDNTMIYLTKATSEGKKEIPVSRKRRSETEFRWKKYLAGVE